MILLQMQAFIVSIQIACSWAARPLWCILRCNLFIRLDKLKINTTDPVSKVGWADRDSNRCFSDAAPDCYHYIACSVSVPGNINIKSRFPTYLCISMISINSELASQDSNCSFIPYSYVCTLLSVTARRGWLWQSSGKVNIVTERKGTAQPVDWLICSLKERVSNPGSAAFSPRHRHSRSDSKSTLPHLVHIGDISWR